MNGGDGPAHLGVPGRFPSSGQYRAAFRRLRRAGGRGGGQTGGDDEGPLLDLVVEGEAQAAHRGDHARVGRLRHRVHMGAARLDRHAHETRQQFRADAPPLPGVLDDQRHLGLVAVPQQMAEGDDVAGRGLRGERTAEARAEQVVQVAARVADRAVVPAPQRLGGAPLVHRPRRVQVGGVRAAHGDMTALGQRQHVTAVRQPPAEPGVQLHQRPGTGELRGRERQIRPLDRQHTALRVAQPDHGVLQDALRRHGPRPGAERRRGLGADRAASQQLAEHQRQFRRVRRGAGGQPQHPGRAVHQVVGVGPLGPGVRAAAGLDRRGEVGAGRHAQQELVDGVRAQRVRLQAQDVYPPFGQRGAQGGQRARLVPHRRPHPPQHALDRRRLGRRGSAAGIVRRRRVAVAACAPCVQRLPQRAARASGFQRRGVRPPSRSFVTSNMSRLIQSL